MAANNKFDASLSSPDGPTYSNGQQRSHSVAPLKKLRKFRKGSDCSLASSSGISKANATSSQGNMTCLVQSLASDLKVVVADHRLNRLGKMKTTITSIFGASANDTPSVKLGTKPLSSSCVEDIKSLKNNLQHSITKARDRVKIFGDGSSKIDKYYHNIRKRSRVDFLQGEQSTSINHQGSVSKIGSQRLEDKTKINVPNRRIRTSLAKANETSKTTGPLERDKDILKSTNGSAAHGDENDRAFSTVVDGWERPRMKKKCSIIELDVPTSSGIVKPQCDQETKRGMQQKIGIEAQPKLNYSRSFRPNSRENICTASPKLPKFGYARGPRSNSGSLSKTSPNIHRVVQNFEDIEPPQTFGVINRKRSASTRPSSPPLCQWAVQRPHKMSRSSRRSNDVADDHEELVVAATAALDNGRVCSSSFWKQVEPIFSFVSTEDTTFLREQIVTSRRESNAFSNGGCERETSLPKETTELNPLVEQFIQRSGSYSGISICQTLISAIIEEDDEISRESSGTNGILETANRSLSSLHQALNQLAPNQTTHFSSDCTENLYNQMSINDRLIMELSGIGLYTEPVPHMEFGEDKDITNAIHTLEEKLHEQASNRRNPLLKLEKAVMDANELQQRKLERLAMDRLVQMAYDRYMCCWGPNASGSKNANKFAKHAAQTFIKRTLERCKKFEETDISCFNEPVFKDMFLSASSRSSSDLRVTDLPAADHNPQTTRKVDTHAKSSNAPFSKEETWSNRTEKKEVLLDDIVANTSCPSSQTPPGLESFLASNTKGRRSERDRNGKGHIRDSDFKNTTTKIGRPSTSNCKVERKNKTKTKVKTAHLSASVNVLHNKATDVSGASLSLPPSTSRSSLRDVKEKEDLNSLPVAGTKQLSNENDPIDLSNLPIPDMDAVDFNGQGQDIASWLNFEEEGMQDQDDLMGLEIPMDDLSDVNMML